MTLGRAIDYELRRTHGLSNFQEGRFRVASGTSRYVVDYLHSSTGPDPATASGRSPSAGSA